MFKLLLQQRTTTCCLVMEHYCAALTYIYFQLYIIHNIVQKGVSTPPFFVHLPFLTFPPFSRNMQAQKFFLGSCSTEMCGHECDQVLIEAAGDLYSIHT